MFPQPHIEKTRNFCQNGDVDGLRQAIYDTNELLLCVHLNEEEQTALMIAAHYGHRDMVEMILSYKIVNLETFDGGNQTPLIIASTFGHKEVVQLLLSAGAQVNSVLEARDYGGRTALLAAAQRDHNEVVEKLLLAGAEVDIRDDDGTTPLFGAVCGNNEDLVKMLLSFGARVNTKDDFENNSLMNACCGGTKNMIEMMAATGANVNERRCDGFTPLMEATFYGHLEIVRSLLSLGANPNLKDNKGETALQAAEEMGKKDIVELLLNYKKPTKNQKKKLAKEKRENGEKNKILTELHEKKELKGDGIDDKKMEFQAYLSKFTLQNQFCQQQNKNKEGETEIMAACFHGDEVKFKSLFSEQAIHSRSNDGKTTLMFACMGGHSHLAQILLECGVNENSRTNDGFTALMYASIAGDPKLVDIILAAGANTCAVNDYGKKAIFYASKNSCVTELFLTTEKNNNEELLGSHKKKAEDKFYCRLCHVSTPNEQSYQLHLQGKKHRRREQLHQPKPPQQLQQPQPESQPKSQPQKEKCEIESTNDLSSPSKSPSPCPDKLKEAVVDSFDALKEEMTCQICYEVPMVDAYQTDCCKKMTICGKCVKQLKITSPNARFNPSNSYTFSAASRCPFCQTPKYTCVPNYPVRRIVEKFAIFMRNFEEERRLDAQKD